MRFMKARMRKHLPLRNWGATASQLKSYGRTVSEAPEGAKKVYVFGKRAYKIAREDTKGIRERVASIRTGRYTSAKQLIKGSAYAGSFQEDIDLVKQKVKARSQYFRNAWGGIYK